MVRNIPIMMLYITFFSRKAGVHNDTNILRDGGPHRLNEERMTTQQGEGGMPKRKWKKGRGTRSDSPWCGYCS
jgi:hypothetical protein